MKAATIGIDLAKQLFQLHGVDRHGKTVLTHLTIIVVAQAQLPRHQLLAPGHRRLRQRVSMIIGRPLLV
ncbi:hypothetical protein [Aeromonas caviae]|uniref:hypothetical protein n=1 Tax=Aeromonas caviae TaxID=648 RepID=UPI0038736B5C